MRGAASRMPLTVVGNNVYGRISRTELYQKVFRTMSYQEFDHAVTAGINSNYLVVMGDATEIWVCSTKVIKEVTGAPDVDEAAG